LRARQTADIAARAWDAATPIVAAALVEGKWPDISRALAPYKNGDTVALVGHETWMSTLTGRLLGSTCRRCFDYRKGGVALIEVENLKHCRGTLLWFIPPRVFRHLR
jgi:phosphohistidine phosphatase SixA